ncbi:ankyrin repeat domain-containing protein [Turneriella parva]|uniref:Uncharacterized protein n=1 Tax=Turneriella parva (strain ATCC BAA-1111 / DSM 21527 / NCTC 11395 / H) TaxID=869212 RepID=I4B673_TURPD|nr:ankyrin repeat domain-containing protein [Turneriella parva]AFM12780.1 hypothetical protein Turpa_2134 [Turneriella parva DSM 21527]
MGLSSARCQLRAGLAILLATVMSCDVPAKDTLRDALHDEAQLAAKIQALDRAHPQTQIFLDRALADAVERKLQRAIVQLSKAGANPLGFSGSKYSALTKAICQGDAALVKTFLQGMPQVDAKTTDEMVAEAFDCKRETMAFMLPEGKRHHANITLVHACRKKEILPRARGAILAGADVNYRGAAGDLPFFYPLCRSNIPLLSLAMRQGLNTEAKNADGKTLFEQAAWSGDLDAVKALVLAGVPVNAGAMVVTFENRTVSETRTEHIGVTKTYGKRKVNETRNVTTKTEIPLLDYAKSRDPSLYRLLKARRKP